MIIDIHAHYHPRAYDEALADFGGGVPGGPPDHPDTDDDEHIRRRLDMMDAAGVAIQVLSPGAARAPYADDENAATRAARIANDAYSELMIRYPERFLAFASLPLPHIDASLRELDRVMEQRGMVGINLHTAVLGRSVADTQFLPVYEEMNRRRGIIFFHPCGNSLESPLLRDYGLGFSAGTLMEDAVIALHLIVQRIPAQFPEITFIIPHLGGPLAMMLERLDSSLRRLGLPEAPSETARRFFYDTVSHGSHAALACVCNAIGAERIVPGSDFPFLLSHEAYERTFSWIREVNIPAADIEQMLEHNAPSILGVS